MTITIIASTQYEDKILNHAAKMQSEGHNVLIPAFDDHKDFDELDVCRYNQGLIEKADEVHILWDNRSVGVVFNFGMAFALKKPVKLIYLESKTFAGVMKKYEGATSAKKAKKQIGKKK